MGAGNLSRLFIDSGAFIALIDDRDSQHKASQSFYKSLTKRATPLIASLPVISETYTWLRYHVGCDVAIRFLGVIERSEKAGFLKTILPDDDLKGKAHAILKKYPDQDLSYADAMSFVILDDMSSNDVFSFDSHFYIAKRTLWPIAKVT
jgi:predicted nucleic acid-binding protein